MRPSRILIGDTIEQMGTLPEKCVQCCVTSPPYWGLRDYGVDGQIGLEETPEEFVAKMVEVGRAVHRVLRDDGTFWLNIGDSYAGNQQKQTGRRDQGGMSLSSRLGPNRDGLPGNSVIDGSAIYVDHGLKPKDLCMIPWRVAMALQADGWWIRSVIVWAKKSPMPESCTDRPTSSWEPIFLLTKSERYFYDAEAVKEIGSTGMWDAMPPIGGIKHAGHNGNPNYSGKQPPSSGTRNQRNVWHLGPEPYKEAHFATFPTEIPRRAIKAGTSEKGCCPACRAPWNRVVARTSIGSVSGSTDDSKSTLRNDALKHGGRVGEVLTKTTGWTPSCECNAGDPVPCLVLDPFLGSGTTVAVARELGRFGVGCELNPEYAKLAARRIGEAERPNTYRDETKETDAPLFTGVPNA